MQNKNVFVLQECLEAKPSLLTYGVLILLLVIFSAPACLLCFYLAFLCYRKALYPHTAALTLVAVFMLLLTLGLLSTGFFTTLMIKEETACYPNALARMIS